MKKAIFALGFVLFAGALPACAAPPAIPPSATIKPASPCGDSGHALAWNGTAYTCQAITGSSGAGGLNTQMQYNNAGGLSGVTGATSNGTSVTLTSPTLITPALGTPASGNASNLTNIPVNSATGVLPSPNGGAGTVNGIVKANGSGTTSAAVSGTDYAPATSGSSVLKGNGSGGFSNAASGTDYAPATSGASILYGNGSGGFSNATIGSGLTFTTGTLSATASGGNTTISPATGNTSGDALCMSNTTTTITDCGFAPAQPSAQLAKLTSFTVTANQFNNQNPVLATGTLTETFPATSTLSANGFQILQNSGTNTLTIQPNAADQVCPSGASCGSAGVAYALTANYGALISTDAAGHLYVTPIPPSGGGSSGITFTDGTHTVTGSTQLTVTGGTVGGSTPNATLTVTGGSGAITLVSTQTASNSASLAWTGLTGTNYRLVCQNILPATNAAIAYLQFGTGGTPTWATSTYRWSGTGTVPSGTTTANGSTSDNGIALVSFGLSNAAPATNFRAQMFNLSSTIEHMVITDGYGQTGGGGISSSQGGGDYNGATTAVTAIRVIMSAGNITSGFCSLYSEQT